MGDTKKTYLLTCGIQMGMDTIWYLNTLEMLMKALQFFLFCLLSVTSLCQTQCNDSIASVGSGIGKIWGYEAFRIDDPNTGVMRYQLTSEKYNDLKLYQTHPSWSGDGNWIIFTSRRTGRQEIYALNAPGSDDCIRDFLIVQLTEDPDLKERHGSTADIAISRDPKKSILYYAGTDESGFVKVTKLDFGSILSAAIRGKKIPEGAVKEIYRTEGLGMDITGAISLDAKEDQIYLGFRRKMNDTIFHQIHAIEVKSGTSEEIFQNVNGPEICHIQANPFRTRSVLFCLVDLKQRMYLIDPVGTEATYLRKGLVGKGTMDNVTHETWVNENTIAFNLNMVHPKHDQLETGIYTIKTGKAGKKSALGKFVTAPPDSLGMFMHNVFYKEEFLIGDVTLKSDYKILQSKIWKYDFAEGSLSKGKLTLLSHDPDRYRGAHAHQSISPDGKWVLIDSRTKSTNLMLIAVP